jgi:hypothetical protein
MYISIKNSILKTSMGLYKYIVSKFKKSSKSVEESNVKSTHILGFTDEEIKFNNKLEIEEHSFKYQKFKYEKNKKFKDMRELEEKEREWINEIMKIAKEGKNGSKA